MGASQASVPDFKLPGTEGEQIEEYQLSDYTDEGAVVLVFYPFDFSPVCTEVLCDFRDAEFLTFTEGIDVFGVSRDSCHAHKKFIDEYDIPFPLLSDTCGEVIAEYGLVYEELDHHSEVPKRALLTIDDSHTVRYRWQTEDAYDSPSLDELHQTVLSLRDGEAA